MHLRHVFCIHDKAAEPFRIAEKLSGTFLVRFLRGQNWITCSSCVRVRLVIRLLCRLLVIFYNVLWLRSHATIGVSDNPNLKHAIIIEINVTTILRIAAVGYSHMKAIARSHWNVLDRPESHLTKPTIRGGLMQENCLSEGDVFLAISLIKTYMYWFIIITVT